MQICVNDTDCFPSLKRLITLKDSAVADSRAHQGRVFTWNGLTESLTAVLRGTKFETILIDPPWYEYYARVGGFFGPSVWTFEDILGLNIGAIAAEQSFCFIWAGNRHVEQATACLVHWGFRKVETICWLKTNIKDSPDYLPYGSQTFFTNCKEYLLMGIRGTVNRSTDTHLIHSNIDSDVVVAPAPEFGSREKPAQIYALIERFCNSQRRIELFAQRMRPGWVTHMEKLEPGCKRFDPQEYDAFPVWVPSCDEIERLRPKSPKMTPNFSPKTPSTPSSKPNTPR